MVSRPMPTVSRKQSLRDVSNAVSGCVSLATLAASGKMTGAANLWGDPDDLDRHGWAFDRFTTPLDYKAGVEGIDVELVSECDTSKSCSVCSHTDDNQRVERGLYVCEKCETAANADVKGAKTIQQKVLPSLATDVDDRDNGWLAQPAVHLFDRSAGYFAPREQVANRKS